jgi:hypothetical protein
MWPNPPHFAWQPAGHHKCVRKSCHKTSTFHITAGRSSKMCPKVEWQNVRILLNAGWTSQHDQKSCNKTPTVHCFTAGWTSQVCPKTMWQNLHILLSSWSDITNLLKNHVTKRARLASGKIGHDVTRHFEEDGHHGTYDNWSTLKPGWMKNTWMDRIGVRMSQLRILSRWFVSGRIVWVAGSSRHLQFLHLTAIGQLIEGWKGGGHFWRRWGAVQSD